MSFHKKEIARKSVSFLGSKIWNDLNQDIKAYPNAVLNMLSRVIFLNLNNI